MKYVLIVACACALVACKSSPPEPLNLENTEELAATVESVDQADRMLTLRIPNGETQTVEVSPEVQNFDQIQTGDRVVVRYYEGLAAAVAEKGEGATLVGNVDETLAGARAEPGQRPAAAVSDVVTTTVVIQAVDKSANTVTFDGPDGTRTVSVIRPEAQKFIAGLQKGDQVDITYVEALAVSVEPMQ